ncbi:MAG: alpha-amylase, partial [Bacteroidetes bacterium]|nr:alpha-amylase [Bacteroidota bacterium]
FRNGDPNNDPTPEDLEGGYPGFTPENWDITPWTHNWYKPDDYFSEVYGKTDMAGYTIQQFSQASRLRRYGGDLQGVLDKVDYIHDLGITAVYFNPLNDAPSDHKYDARNWRHIDRNFGPDPRRDVEIISRETPDDPETWEMTGADSLFVEVVKAFHEKGIKVIMDYSFNHTGVDCWAWKDLVEKQTQSKYKNWYWVNSFDNPETPENEFDYRGWFGVKDLPEIKETEYQQHAEKIVAFEGDLADQGAKQHIFNVAKRWLDPNQDGDPSDGVDGFRLDVAVELPLGFWREFREEVRSVNPETYMVGEVWWEKWPDDLMDPAPFVKGDIFDAVMHYRWYRPTRHFFAQAPDQLSVSEYVSQLKHLRKDIRPQSSQVMMNVAASHDSPRLSTSLYNRENKYKFGTEPSGNPDYKLHKPDAQTWATQKLLLVQQFTYIGAPHIWAGDEMGMWGADMGDTR